MPPTSPGLVPLRPAGATRARPHPLPDVSIRRSMQRVMWAVQGAGASDALLQRLWQAPDEVIASARMLKDGDRCTVVRLDEQPAQRATLEPVGDGPDEEAEATPVNDPAAPTAQPVAGAVPARSFMLKRYNLKSSLHTALHMPLRSRARWSWLNGRKLLRAGLATPAPLACIEERRHSLLHLRSYLLTEFVPGRTLLDLALSSDASPDLLADFAKQFARIWQTLGQLRAGHGDMKASNFIVDPGGRLWLIDLDGLRIHHSALLLRRERRNDLGRFMRNWQERPEIAAVFRARIGTG